MKITINMDDDLLDRVIGITGLSTKTEAIHFALREVVRRAQLIEVLREGTGASENELREMFDEASDPLKMRVAETSAAYSAKSRKRKSS